MFTTSTVSAVLALTAISMLGALASIDNSTAVTSNLYVNYFTESQDQCSQVTETVWEIVQQVQYITSVPSITMTQWETVLQTSYITPSCTVAGLPSSTDSIVSYSSTESTVQDTSSTVALSTPETTLTLIPSTSTLTVVPITTMPQVADVSTPTTTLTPTTSEEVAYVSTAVDNTPENASYQYSGDGTYFTPGLGACGWNNVTSDLIAALNGPQFGDYVNGADCPYCGKCAQVKGPLGTVKVEIVDKCPPCKSGDLDLSPAAFNQIGDPVQGRIHISWNFVAC